MDGSFNELLYWGGGGGDVRAGTNNWRVKHDWEGGEVEGGRGREEGASCVSPLGRPKKQNLWEKSEKGVCLP